MQFAILNPLFERTFCAPCTSAIVERVFRHRGLFVGPHRANMSDNSLWSWPCHVRCNSLIKPWTQKWLCYCPQKFEFALKLKKTRTKLTWVINICLVCVSAVNISQLPERQDWRWLSEELLAECFACVSVMRMCFFLLLSQLIALEYCIQHITNQCARPTSIN